MASNTLIIHSGADSSARPDLRFVDQAELVITPPGAYRCLDSDGFTSVEVAPWAEHRQCLYTGVLDVLLWAGGGWGGREGNRGGAGWVPQE